ncbi:MAG: hypothetical protein JWM95_1352 [Gemmatimonadetes bacterium]|nr:hypothetical protein [Gemmatimonadota bacterium]
MSNETNSGGGAGNTGGGGEPKVQIKVQTPRGLWSMDEPKDATHRPEYPISAKIQNVIDDVRNVFKFAESDSKYTLFLGKVELDPNHTLASHQIKTGTLLVLSVQGGNA